MRALGTFGRSGIWRGITSALPAISLLWSGRRAFYGRPSTTAGVAESNCGVTALCQKASRMTRRAREESDDAHGNPACQRYGLLCPGQGQLGAAERPRPAARSHRTGLEPLAERSEERR